MKNVILVSVMLLFTTICNAQPPSYNDLTILFADGNYEKLIKAADKYTQKEDTKNDALPYFWKAKGLYSISFKGDRDEEYKNAFNESISVLSSCRKKDKDGSVYQEKKEFFDIVKISLTERILNDISSKDYKKANGWILKFYKISPNNVGAQYLQAACNFRSGDKGGANSIWKVAEKELMALSSLDDFSEKDKEILKIGVLETAECYMFSKQVDKTRDLLNKVAPWYADDEDFKEKQKELIP
jgi:hypothetical protein